MLENLTKARGIMLLLNNNSKDNRQCSNNIKGKQNKIKEMHMH